MNRNPPLTELTGDHLDRLLSSFFRAELPKSFPPPPVPASERPMPAGRLPDYAGPGQPPALTRARVSLAVSVALLLGGCWLLSGKNADAPAPTRIGTGLNDGSAKRAVEVIPMPKNAKIIKPMP